MTFTAYQRATRMGRALGEIRGGTPVVRAQVGAGFQSGSGFREACEKLFGVAAAWALAKLEFRGNAFLTTLADLPSRSRLWWPA